MAIKTEEEVKKELDEQSRLESRITKLCVKYARMQVKKGYIIDLRELERDGIIFGERDYKKVVTEIRIRRWVE